jgi:NAD(P)H-hydrate epimerase
MATVTIPTADPALPLPLPSNDPFLADRGLDLPALARHWRPLAHRAPMSGEAMRGADLKAQRNGIPAERLMEEAGAAVAAAVRALLVTTERTGHGPVLVLAGPGNNGGDGSVAARHLASAGIRVACVLVATEDQPTTTVARGAWERLEGTEVERIHAAHERDIRFLLAGIEKAAIIVDALLGSGVHGALREPIRTAVDLIVRGRAAGVPVLAVDTPTAVDLTGGEASDPVVRADVTVTFHRPKLGHATRVGRALAGRVLVAPIGIPAAADPDA